MLSYNRLSIAVFCLLLMGAGSAFGQGMFGSTNTPNGSGSASYYYLGGREGMTISVNLWGFVVKPGRYDVPSSTTLVQLISYGGGPTEYAKLDGAEIVRQEIQADSTYVTEVIPIDLEMFEKKGAKSPLLLPGDTVIIPGSSFNAVRDVVGLFGEIGMILSGVATLILVLQK